MDKVFIISIWQVKVDQPGNQMSYNGGIDLREIIMKKRKKKNFKTDDHVQVAVDHAYIFRQMSRRQYIYWKKKQRELTIFNDAAIGDIDVLSFISNDYQKKIVIYLKCLTQK